MISPSIHICLKLLLLVWSSLLRCIIMLLIALVTYITFSIRTQYWRSLLHLFYCTLMLTCILIMSGGKENHLLPEGWMVCYYWNEEQHLHQENRTCQVHEQFQSKGNKDFLKKIPYPYCGMDKNKAVAFSIHWQLL